MGRNREKPSVLRIRGQDRRPVALARKPTPGLAGRGPGRSGCLRKIPRHPLKSSMAERRADRSPGPAPPKPSPPISNRAPGRARGKAPPWPKTAGSATPRPKPPGRDRRPGARDWRPRSAAPPPECARREIFSRQAPIRTDARSRRKAFGPGGVSGAALMTHRFCRLPPAGGESGEFSPRPRGGSSGWSRSGSRRRRRRGG